MMRASQSGDQHAYKILLKQLRPMIQSYIKRRVFDQNYVEDLCQEILIKIHSYRHTYDPEQIFEAWLFTICRNQIIDFMRAQGRRKEVAGLAMEEITTSATQPDAEARIALENAMALLSPDQRQTLELAKLQGLSLEEVAERTGASLSAVKVRTHRALKIIQETMFGTGRQR